MADFNPGAGRFTLYAQVTWTSQSAGIRKTKAGTICEVVPAGHYPRHLTAKPLMQQHLPGTRDHESYAVLVVENKTRKRIYWPRVSQLAAVESVSREKTPTPDEWAEAERRAERAPHRCSACGDVGHTLRDCQKAWEPS